MSDSSKQSASARPIPLRCGIGLRTPHHDEVLRCRPPVGFLEVHSENFFDEGGRAMSVLDAAAAQYPISLHGVGLSLGSADELNAHHLRQLRALIGRVQPALVSEHLSWTSVDGQHLHQLLPLPYTEEALRHICTRIDQTQDLLGRRILVENPSSYFAYRHSTIAEPVFLAEVVRRSDCDILLDVNNVYVSACNLGFDAVRYLESVPAARVAEMHLAGHTVRHDAGGTVLIDTHDQRVCDAVWQLYAHAVQLFPGCPTLIEWDSDLPALEVLLDEATRAQRIQESEYADAA